MTPTPNTNRELAIRLNIWVLRLTRNWLKIALTVVGIYTTLPLIAPTLMELGLTGPARTIYTMYSPFCHQMAFRSIFLYGEQSFYPRSNTGSDLGSFESYAQGLAEFEEIDLYTFDLPLLQSTRAFLGNEQMGYKTALCGRDMFIYIALFTGGLLYAIPYVRRRLRPAPIWLYILLGLGPIGLDGFSQMLGYAPFGFWPERETLPIFRVVTGATFGFMNAWLGFPYLELAMRDTRQQIEYKLRRIGIEV